MPGDVLERPKLWASREPPAWSARLASELAPLVFEDLAVVDALLDGDLRAALPYLARRPGTRPFESVDGPYGFLNPLGLALWRRLFLRSGPAAAPPSWESLARR